MPGFNVSGIGGGFEQGPSNVLEVRRNHRWIFESIGRGEGTFSQAELLVLQSASRPSLKYEEPEMHHNQEVVRFAGKQSWDPISLVWYDVEQDPDISRGIYHWIETVVNMETIAVAHPRFYKRQAVLSMIDGQGDPNETWTLYGTWPTNCNWQKLDYTAYELQTIECTMRYDRAIRQCVKAQPPTSIGQVSCPQGS